MSHSWDPDRYLVYADERGRPFVDLLARVGADHPGPRRRHRLRARNLTALLARALAGRRRPRRRLLAPRWSSGAPVAEGVRVERATCGPGSPRSRSTCCCPTRPTSGCPATSTCCHASSGTWRPGAGSPFQVPGNHDEPSHALLPRPRLRPALRPYTAGVARPHAHDPEVYAARCSTSVSTWTPGRRRTCTGSRARTRCSPGSAAPVRGRRCRRCPTTSGRSSSRSTRRCSARPTRPARTAPHPPLPPRLRRRPRAVTAAGIAACRCRSDGSMSALRVREAVAADLADVVSLQREDVIREVHEDDVPSRPTAPPSTRSPRTPTSSCSSVRWTARSSRPRR